MVLVDTTVWVDLLREQHTAPVKQLLRLLDRNEAAIAPVIFQELLQGAASPEKLVKLSDYFGELPSLVSADPMATHGAAAELYARCRWRGVTPRSPHDCLIAQSAIEYSVRLLHDDRDFVAIAKVEPRLKLYPSRDRL